MSPGDTAGGVAPDATPARAAWPAASAGSDAPAGPVGLLGLAALATATLVIVTLGVTPGGFLIETDVRVLAAGIGELAPGLLPWVDTVVRLGQRAVVLPFVALAAVLAARRRGSWRPYWLVGAAVLALNLVVGGMKIVTARPSPRTGDPAMFTDGMLYPSGHTANSVLMWGLVAYFLTTTSRARAAAFTAVAVLAAVVGGCSLYLDTHWLSDLVAGYAAGLAMLAALMAADHMLAQRDTHRAADRPDGQEAGSKLAATMSKSSRRSSHRSTGVDQYSA